MQAVSLAAPPRKDTQTAKKAEEFDAALEHLRRAKRRLDDAANLYLQRLEGNRGDKRDS